MWETVLAEGFTRDLKPFPNAIAVLKELTEDFNVFIVSSLHVDFIHNCDEKLEWVKQHLGDDWVHRLILTGDKTVVKGGILIDDKPVITGSIEVPEWTHIHFGTTLRTWEDVATMFCF